MMHNVGKWRRPRIKNEIENKSTASGTVSSTPILPEGKEREQEIENLFEKKNDRKLS